MKRKKNICLGGHIMQERFVNIFKVSTLKMATGTLVVYKDKRRVMAR